MSALWLLKKVGAIDMQLAPTCNKQLKSILWLPQHALLAGVDRYSILISNCSISPISCSCVVMLSLPLILPPPRRLALGSVSSPVPTAKARAVMCSAISATAPASCRATCSKNQPCPSHSQHLTIPAIPVQQSLCTVIIAVLQKGVNPMCSYDTGCAAMERHYQPERENLFATAGG